MGTTANKGPLWVYGAMQYITAALGGATGVLPEYDPDQGPSAFINGVGQPDVRFILQSAKLQGYGGVQPAFLHSQGIEVVDAVPSAYGTAKIAALAHVTNGTKMTLVTAAAAGISVNVPIAPFSGAINGAAITVAPIVLDFGFAFGTAVSGSKTLTVADSTQFTIGMPLVIASGTSATSALLTWVTSLGNGATTITVNDALGVNGTVAIGTGDIWPGAPLSTAAQQYPLGHLPYIAGGPGAFLDAQQALARGVSITCSSASGVGGTVRVQGWDTYWQPMHENIVIAPGTALTAYGKKAFKAIQYVQPAFTDATYNYSVGTSDVFGLNLRARNWERTSGAWAAGFLTGSGGFTPFAPAATGDVRGTMQVSAIGGGAGYGTTASNGAITSLVMTGNRLALFQSLSTADSLAATPLAPQTMFGATQT